MTSNLNPYISFDGNAREAMEYYRSVFGGALTLNTYSDFGRSDEPEADKIMHSRLETGGGFTLMGADTPPGMAHNPGDNVAVMLSGDDAAELRGYWEQLADSGTVTVPLEKQMWGDEFGQCIDQYGIGWMVNISAPQS